MRVVAVIPSRYKSSRFIGKPLAIINGKPMIQRVYESALQSSILDDIYVATDDNRIKKVVTSFGGNVIMTSPSHKSGTDRVYEAVKNIDLDKNDLVINIQGDQPLFNKKCLLDLISPFFSRTDVEMSTLAFPIRHPEEIDNSKDVKVTFDLQGFALYFSRSKIPYNRDPNTDFVIYKHLGLYAYKKHLLETFNNLSVGKLETIEKLEQLRLLEYGYRIFVTVTAYDSPEVDVPEDIKDIEKK